MRMMDKMNMIAVVSDINTLIDKYGLEAFKAGYKFVVSFPVVTPAQVEYTDDYGAVWFIDQSDHDEIGRLMRAQLKISAIKKFREITACSLREAKVAVERKHENRV